LRHGGTASREAHRNDDTARFHTKSFVFGPPNGRPVPLGNVLCGDVKHTVGEH